MEVPRSQGSRVGTGEGTQNLPGSPASAEKTFGFEGAESSYGQVSGSFSKDSRFPGTSISELVNDF